MSLNKNIKRVLIALPLILIGGLIAYKITYKPHETIENMKIDFTGTSNALLQQVEQEPNHWNNKIVELSGTITQIESNSFMLGSNIYCQKNTNTSHFGALEIGTSQHIKGRIIGYDDLLEELKLDKVILVNK